MAGRMEPPVFIHVGFANTGTTSLQRNFLAARDDVFFVGEPYGDFGGIFTAIKSVEDYRLDAAFLGTRCRDLIRDRSDGRRVVISDESFCDTPELYFTPYTMPRDSIALRLQRLFPSAKIIFTVRDQRRYAASMYLNLKRNAAFFDRMPMPSFSDWLAGTLTPVRGQYLQNLNFTDIINLYAAIFGRENLCVLPLEMLEVDGAGAYLGKLCAFMDLRLTEADLQNYVPIRNRRMAARRELVAELLHDDRFGRFFSDLTDNIGRERLNAFLDSGPFAKIELSAVDEEHMRRSVGTGNWLLARQFDLPLGRYGYPVAEDGAFSARELAVAKRELCFQADLDRLRSSPPSSEQVEARWAAEVARLQTSERELARVSQSPVWRSVKRLDGARRLVARAATAALSFL
jgi:hypothetical protein